MADIEKSIKRYIIDPTPIDYGISDKAVALTALDNGTIKIKQDFDAVIIPLDMADDFMDFFSRCYMIVSEAADEEVKDHGEVQADSFEG